MPVIQKWRRESKARAISLGTEVKRVLEMAVKSGTGIKTKQIPGREQHYSA